MPVDDGASDHLEGMRMPEVTLVSTAGDDVDLATAASGTLVLYCYPRTGRPGEELPPGWDDFPGARGCTPQACAFRDHTDELVRRGARIHGLSGQTVSEQREFADRVGLPYPLLSDPGFELASALRLPTFELDGSRYYGRVTLMCRRREIVKVFYPVFPPNRNAADVAAWLAAHPE
jgi:peroxiredoxin